MILSRFLLNFHSREVQRALADSHAMHARIMSMFPEVDSATPRAALGVLHRLDRSDRDERLVLLVQSRERPDVARLPVGFLDPDAGQDAASSTDLAPVIDAIHVGARFRFRLRANPTRKIDTKSSPDGKRRNGKRVPVRGEEGKLSWLTRHFEACGIKLPGPCQVRPDGKSVGRLRGSTRTHEAHIFEGVLEVADTERARHALEAGIGPAKAYGFGLLSLARAP